MKKNIISLLALLFVLSGCGKIVGFVPGIGPIVSDSRQEYYETMDRINQSNFNEYNYSGKAKKSYYNPNPGGCPCQWCNRNIK